MSSRYKLVSPELLERAIKLGFDGEPKGNLNNITLTDIQYWLAEIDRRVEPSFIPRSKVYWCFAANCNPAMISENGHNIPFPTLNDAIEAGIIKQFERMESEKPKKVAIGRYINDGKEIQWLMQDETNIRKFDTIEQGCEFLRGNGSTLTNEEMQAKFKFEPII